MTNRHAELRAAYLHDQAEGGLSTIKHALKEHFPATNFEVTLHEHGKPGEENSYQVHIQWLDGAPKAAVQAIADEHGYQVNCVSCQRFETKDIKN